MTISSLRRLLPLSLLALTSLASAHWRITYTGGSWSGGNLPPGYAPQDSAQGGGWGSGSGSQSASGTITATFDWIYDSDGAEPPSAVYVLETASANAAHDRSQSGGAP